MAVAIAWEEGGEGVICQSSLEIAGSPRNLLKKDSPHGVFLLPLEGGGLPPHRGRTAPGRTDLGTPSADGGGRTDSGRQGPGSNGQDPHTMEKAPKRGLSDRKETAFVSGEEGPSPSLATDPRGVGLEAAIPEGMRNSTAVWTPSIVDTRI